MKLRELAHSRTGDKGNTLNISVICYDAQHYEHLRAHVDAGAGQGASERCRARRGRRATSCRASPRSISSSAHALGGGVTRSLALDAHGKSLSSALMGMEVDAP